MVSVVRTPGSTTLSIDGSAVKTLNYPIHAISIANNGLWLGADQDSVGGGWQNAHHLTGKLDDVRIYDRALSESEAAGLAGITASFDK